MVLRACRLRHACFSDWLLTELAQQAGDAEMITATTLSVSRIVAGYIDQTFEEVVAAYTQAREDCFLEAPRSGMVHTVAVKWMQPCPQKESP